MGEHGVVVWDREKTWRTGASASGSGGRRPSSNGGRNDRNSGGRGGRGGDRNGGGRGGRGGGGGRRAMDFGPTGHDYEVSREAGPIQSMYSEPEIHELIAERLQCKMSRNFDTADAIQADLIAAGVYVHDGLKEWRADGETFGDYNGTGNSAGPGVSRGSRNDRSRPYEQSSYSVASSDDASFSPDDLAEFQSLVEERSQAKMARDYVTADAIREDLRAQSVLIDDKLKEWSVGGDFGPNASSYSQDKDRPYTKSQLSAALDSSEDGLEDMIESELERRGQAKQDRDFDVADSIREELASKYNVVINDRLREWSVGGDFGEGGSGGQMDRNRPYVRRGGGDLSDDQVSTIQSMVFERAEAKKNRDFNVADDIRDELRDTYSVSLDDKTREWRILSEDYALVSADGSSGDDVNTANLDEATMQYIQEKLMERSRAKVNREYDIADDIRDELRETYSVNVNDRTREWRIEPRDNDDNNNYAPQQTQQSEPKYEGEAEPTSVLESEEHVNDDDSTPGQDQDLSSLTVVELKEKLRAAGRPISGKKAELIERLLE
jgi:cysteinyl-tRNA synthetase